MLLHDGLQMLHELSEGVLQVRVGELPVQQLLQFLAHACGHAVEQRLHRLHVTRQLFQQLLESFWGRSGEHVSVRVEKLLKVALFAPGALLEQSVEILEHLPHALQVIGTHILETLLERVKEGCKGLLLQRLQQRLKVGARLLIHKVVLLQALDGLAEVAWQVIQYGTSFRHDVFHLLDGAAFVLLLLCRLGRVIKARRGPLSRCLQLRLEGLTLTRHDLVKLAP
jgi:hypothetical protein